MTLTIVWLTCMFVVAITAVCALAMTMKALQPIPQPDISGIETRAQPGLRRGISE